MPRIRSTRLISSSRIVLRSMFKIRDSIEVDLIRTVLKPSNAKLDLLFEWTVVGLIDAVSQSESILKY